MTTPNEFFRWWIIDQRTGKRRRTTFKLTRAEAEHRYPGAEPDLQTREIRNVPSEIHGNSKPLVASSAPDEPLPISCAFCGGSGWLCADHPTLPWEHDGCGAEGAPCVCNPSGAVQWKEIYAERADDEPRH